MGIGKFNKKSLKTEEKMSLTGRPPENVSPNNDAPTEKMESFTKQFHSKLGIGNWSDDGMVTYHR